MSFERRKRFLVAALGALAPFPLLFNDVLEWPFLLLFWLGVGLFAWRVWEGTARPIPNWSMNLLGVAYLPVFLLEFGFFWQGRLLRPLVHLALFALVVKLFGMRRERDKWHVFLLIFFLFVGAMGSSVHPSVLAYLVAFLALAVLTLSRFASFHLLSSYGAANEQSRPLPLGGFVVAATLLTMIGAIPLFVLLPRLGGPYLVGPGGGGGSGGPSRSALSDSITLDVIGRVRTSREVAMRVAYETPPPVGHEMRFRAGVFSHFVVDGWERGDRELQQVRRGRDGFFRVGEGAARAWAQLWLEPAAGTSIVVPIEAVVLDLRSAFLQGDSAGVVSLPVPAPGTLAYRAGMASESELRVFGAEPEVELELDPSEPISPAIADLARSVAGSATAQVQATRIESFLSTEYRYTLDLVGTRTADPVEAFLFEWKQGHCEYFASAMVLMLRSVGIPARLATGYLGGEYNPFEGYYVLRQSDAHAWVEAYSPEQGWAVYDPTPPDGRPQARSSGLGHMLAQAYDYLVFRWDRYVLTYGFFDQVGLARQFLIFWKGWLQGLRANDSESPSSDADGSDESLAKPDGETPAESLDYDWTGIEVVPLALLIIFAAWWIWRHRPEFSAVRAYRKLRSGVERSRVLTVAPAVAPLRLAEEIERHRPAASEPARRVIELYLRESFGGQPLDDDELAEIRIEVREALHRLRKSA